MLISRAEREQVKLVAVSTCAGEQRGQIALATEPPFRLGPLAVAPALRQVTIAGESRILEPRVMQVLVALAQAGGGIVGRDELFARCWDGRIVGENAINRVVSLLRTLAAETKAFEIDTVTKVGYRLREGGAVVSGPAPPAATARLSMPRRAALAGIGAAAAGGAAYLLLANNLSSPSREAEQHYRAGIDNERLGDSGVIQAIAHYEAAVQADPEFAMAWGALARALTSAIDARSEDRAQPLVRRARQSASRALQLNPRNADALLARAMVEPVFRNWEAAENSAQAALATHPDLNPVRAKLAKIMANVGRNRHAALLMRQAVARAPLLPGQQVRLAWLSWQIGDPGEARRILDWAYRTWPAHIFVWIYRTMFLSLTGETAGALRMTEGNQARTAAGGPLPASVASLCARALARDATAPDRRVAIEAILASRRAGDIASFISVVYLSALGDADTAFEQSYTYLLGRRDPLSGERQPLPAYSERWTDFLFAQPTAPMRADPRFPGLTAAIGLDAYWQATGSRPDYLAK